MKGYLIAQINVNNLENYQEYLKNVTPIAEKFGWNYIIRAGKYEIFEGNWPYKRNVVIKFPSIEKDSPFLFANAVLIGGSLKTFADMTFIGSL